CLTYVNRPENRGSLIKLKEEILARVGLGPSAAAAEFHRWGLKPANPPTQMTQLLRTAKRWLQPEQLGPEAVTERVVMDHYLRSLPLELRKAVGLRNPTSAKEMVPTARVHLGQRSRNWELSIGLVPDLPYFLLVGRDYPNFDEELRGKPERE
uniref:SCAN box domain-containing protein n=1 Tax=Astyanax mexicanus TaxID=7994 RepID=A0A3B1JX94_ASTMX